MAEHSASPESRLTNVRMSRSDLQAYCPVCTRCFAGDPKLCPECASPRPDAQWPPVGDSSYLYLGSQLDERYVVDRFVGAGATGDVYRATGTRIKRPFALKIVDTRRYGRQDIEQELLRRLQMEVDAMSQLRNPHVVNVYELFSLTDHVFVMVMDFIDDVSLLERVEQAGRLGFEESVEIVRQVANGLHEAHQRGIIHRDIKPDNIMVEQMPASGVFARVLDFGIAYMVDSVRVSSAFRGTPLYASPEQCHSQGSLSPRSDVYSLGCVLFHLLTGRPPYVFEHALAVMEAHIDAPVPSIFDLLAPDQAPVELDALVGRMLAKSPADRPRDGGAVVRELDAIARALRTHRPAQPSELPVDAGYELGNQETSLPAPPQILPGPILPGASEARARAVIAGELPAPETSAPQVVRQLASIPLPSSLSDPPRPFSAQVVGPGGDYAVLADKTRQVHLIGLKTDLATLSFSGFTGHLRAVCVDAHRGDVYAGGDGEVVFRWSMGRTSGAPQKVVDVGSQILALDEDMEGSRLAIGTVDGRALIYDLRTQRRTLLYTSALPVRMVKFIPGSSRVLMGWEGGRLGRVEQAPGQTSIYEFEPLDTKPVSAAVCPGGELAAVLEESGQLRVFELTERAAFLRVEASHAPLTALAFSPSGSLHALGMTIDELQLWGIRHEQLVRHLSEMSLTMSP